ncbi:MAG TPA: VOC family protein [Burkholderiales bacterium]|nr:VOC family protein [Burkholderiales bacterium]
MPDLPRWELSHIGIYVIDMDKVCDFYTRVLGFRVMDSGALKNRQRLTFLSKDPKDHHQVVLVSGREPGTASTINQITFRVASIKEVRTMHDWLVAHDVEGIDPVDHGNAWSVYFRDPEGNRLEFFCDTPWYVAQPRRDRLDFSLSDEAIEETTRRRIADDPTTVAFADWRNARKKEMDLA